MKKRILVLCLLLMMMLSVCLAETNAPRIYGTWYAT